MRGSRGDRRKPVPSSRCRSTAPRTGRCGVQLDSAGESELMCLSCDQRQAPMLFEVTLSTLDLTSILAHIHRRAGARDYCRRRPPAACGHPFLPDQRYIVGDIPTGLVTPSHIARTAWRSGSFNPSQAGLDEIRKRICAAQSCIGAVRDGCIGPHRSCFPDSDEWLRRSTTGCP